MSTQDLLLEIGCEELPASAQINLSAALSALLSKNLAEANLPYENIKIFATPRRLAVIVNGLADKQPPVEIERQGPGFEQAYDKQGTPTLACLGFAKSCDTSVDQLTVKETEKGRRVICITKKPGANTSDILAELVTKVISALPMSKPMRWNNHDIAFIRPVHWVVLLFGEALIPAKILGQDTVRETQGHRFHHPKPIRISKPADYSMLLYSQGFVIADFETRKKRIEKSIQQIAGDGNHAVINPDLLNEVTALVEWPVVLRGSFDKRFLAVPKEALISALETHQKCFPIENTQNQLQPCFILVSNIDSKNKELVIQGNERVVRARLSDAEFFYNQDCKKALIDYLPRLDNLVFQDQLGSLGDKTKRLVKLADFIAKKINAHCDATKRAALLSKCDLVTGMVGEFPNLQGTMGYYYALNNQESEIAANAIKEYYFPKFSGDILPASLEGAALALADRLDTLMGIFGVNQLPTGDKDPFGLRRSALGILRILIEKNLNLDLMDILRETEKLYNIKLPNKSAVQNAFDFIMTRLKSSYIEKNISPEIFEAVLASKTTSPVDFDLRLKAVVQFQTLPESSSLAAANKRVSNILKKEEKNNAHKKINETLFEGNAEKVLYQTLISREKIVNNLYQNSDYTGALTELSTLKDPVDQFFNDVMIMAKDEKVRQNRLALLGSIRALLSKVADISLLPS